MTYKFLFIILIITMLVGCKSGHKSEITENQTVLQLLSHADELIGDEVAVSGMVSHVCSHAGRRCFIVDLDSDKSIRIEASDQIGSFSKELTGNEIVVKGILRENRLSATEIDEWESEVIAENPEDVESDGEHCSAEMSNIRSMRAWMKEHGKDYYAIYYIDGQSYELVQ